MAVLIALTLLIGLGVFLAWRSHQDGLPLHARMPEQGGWDPSALSATVGQPLHLRLTSDDVTHGFAVGQTDWPAVDVYPGEVTEVTLTFDHPGTYVFYCTRWCGANHWRMRGTIQVAGADGSPGEPAATAQAPLYTELSLDIDAPHPASATPQAVALTVTKIARHFEWRGPIGCAVPASVFRCATAGWAGMAAGRCDSPRPKGNVG